MRMRRVGHSQLPDPLDCARVEIFVRTDTSPSAVELLHHLGVTTLTFAYDSTAGVLLHFFLKSTIIFDLRNHDECKETRPLEYYPC